MSQQVTLEILALALVNSPLRNSPLRTSPLREVAFSLPGRSTSNDIFEWRRAPSAPHGLAAARSRDFPPGKSANVEGSMGQKGSESKKHVLWSTERQAKKQNERWRTIGSSKKHSNGWKLKFCDPILQSTLKLGMQTDFNWSTWPLSIKSAP